jgi:hypothetical protein
MFEVIGLDDTEGTRKLFIIGNDAAIEIKDVHLSPARPKFLWVPLPAVPAVLCPGE